ncbi:DUF302 domain-containing protein [candidate division KSB1 bacterium]|nr:DUF302 domain-containing protein [candidate division KSB1 bacterium]
MKYYLSKILNESFEESISSVTEELKREGFGILTEIDVEDTLKEKLDVDFRKYKILGACNPPLAHKALQAESRIGLMLPCNVIVQDVGGGKTEVAAVDPFVMMQSINNPDLGEIANEVQTKLKNVIDAL